MCLLFFIKFLFLIKWYSFKNFEKIFLFHLKALFVLEIFKVLHLCSPLFPTVSHCFRDWSKINLNVYDIINCQNKNLITHFVWYLEKEKKVWHWNLSIHAENVHQKLVPDPFLILVNNPKQPLHVRHSFKNKRFWKRIIKKP